MPIVEGAGVAGTAAPGVITVQGVAGGTAQPISGTVTATPSGTQASSVADGANVNQGANGDAAIVTDTTGTLSGKLRGIVSILASLKDTLGRFLVMPKYTHTYVAAGQATTVIKGSAGVLHTITFWAAASATNVTTIYDNATGVGTIIGLPAATTATIPITLTLDVAFLNGLTVITSAANSSPMTFSWL